ALDRLFRNHGLHLNDVERLALHGGSLRLFVEGTEEPTERVQKLLEAEKDAGVDRIDYYRTFAERVHGIRTRLTALLKDLKEQGSTIVGYAAAAKATTLLSYCQIDKTLIHYIVDLNEFKQGRYMPGNH